MEIFRFLLHKLNAIRLITGEFEPADGFDNWKSRKSVSEAEDKPGRIRSLLSAWMKRFSHDGLKHSTTLSGSDDWLTKGGYPACDPRKG